MSDRITAAEDGLRFFGKVTASISHEISNVLATIYENAGLVEDLLAAAERGRPLDPFRLKDLASRVKTQVRRGREIVENMNRFAHSADEPLRAVDLSEMLSLSASLAQRTASMHGAVLEPERAAKALQVRTDPFLLQNLIWSCLIFLVEADNSSKRIRLTAEAGPDGPCIRFTGVDSLPPETLFPTSAQEILSQAVGARLSMVEGGILLSIPKDEQNNSISPQRDEGTKKETG
jgi:C4-dicarboxylate-specific signal transduction histidine kinase